MVPRDEPIGDHSHVIKFTPCNTAGRGNHDHRAVQQEYQREVRLNQC